MDLVSNNIFKDANYDTKDGKRTFFNRLILGNRFDFYIRNFIVFAKTGACARQGKLDAEKQVYYSTQNIHITEKCGGKIHLRGLDNLRELENKSVVLVSNHMSLLETALLHSFLRPHVDFSFVVKASLIKIPYFGDILTSMNAIPVTRRNPREDFKNVLSAGTKILQEGRSLVIFPQATRSVEFKPEEFNTIGVKLAKAANVPIVPMALKTNFVKTGKIVRDLGPVKQKEEIFFDFGKPINVDGNGKEAHLQVIEFIQNRLSAWELEQKKDKKN